MNDGNGTTVREAPRVEGEAPEPGREASGLPTTKPIEALLGRLGPQAVFGEPVLAGETTIIPVAEVRTGFGFGGGRGRRTAPAAERAAEEEGGSGGGAGARVLPRGYLHIDGAKVRYEPIIDVTRLALAGMALTAWMTFVIGKALQR